jgi:hypothetical protein
MIGSLSWEWKMPVRYYFGSMRLTDFSTIAWDFKEIMLL